MGKPWDPSEPNSIECLQVVYKIAERCNINCSYCYYFNMGDDTALGRPARASVGSTINLAKWIAAGCADLRIPRVNISFHGGEPMLAKPDRFAKMCEAFLTHIGPVAEVRFAIQTNGTIFNNDWLRVLVKYRVSIGISIDGDRADHDRFRLDHRGRSTFTVTENTIRTLVEASAVFPSLRPSTISVLDRHVDYAATFRYLRALGIMQMHFLFPDRNANDHAPQVDKEAAEIGSGLLDLFTEWMIEDNPDIHVRFIDRALGYFRQGASPKPVPRRRKSNQVLVARSDETVAIDDSYIPALDWYAATPEFAIADTNLRGVLADPVFPAIETETSKLPDACTSCRWQDICHGGDLENRFSDQNGFNNPSVYCAAYKELYAGICNVLMNSGYPQSEIQRRFGDEHRV